MGQAPSVRRRHVLYTRMAGLPWVGWARARVDTANGGSGSYCLPDSISRPEAVYVFNYTNAGDTSYVNCPLGYAGLATRLCKGNGNTQFGVWDTANINCNGTVPRGPTCAGADDTLFSPRGGGAPQSTRACRPRD